MTVPGEDGKEATTAVVAMDDGVRPTTTAEKLGKLKPVFKKDGSTTAGNSSQVSDGAAAVLGRLQWTKQTNDQPTKIQPTPTYASYVRTDLPLPQPSCREPNPNPNPDPNPVMRKSKAEAMGLPILGALRAYSVVGVPPDIMGIGPAKVSGQGRTKSYYLPPNFNHCLGLGLGSGLGLSRTFYHLTSTTARDC